MKSKSHKPSNPLIDTKAQIPPHIQKDLNKIIFTFGMPELLLFLRDYSYVQSNEWREEGDTAKAIAWLKLAKHFDI